VSSHTIGPDELAAVVRAPSASDDKYSRGVVGLVVGSDAYPGAALLACDAALSAGAGMVRLVSSAAAEQVVLSARPEVVITPGRVDALVVGCGMPSDDTPTVTNRLSRFPLRDTLPVVIDAGALASTPAIAGARSLTPHRRELAALARERGYSTADPHDQALRLATEWDVVVYLKGSRSEVFTPEGLAYELPDATPWLATAGTGDVLAGVMGALLAQQKKETWSHAELARAAAVAGTIHAMAAQRVSSEAGGGSDGPIHASELGRGVSAVIAQIVA